MPSRGVVSKPSNLRVKLWFLFEHAPQTVVKFAIELPRIEVQLNASEA